MTSANHPIDPPLSRKCQVCSSDLIRVAPGEDLDQYIEPPARDEFGTSRWAPENWSWLCPDCKALTTEKETNV
jgi:hypothetical protein